MLQCDISIYSEMFGVTLECGDEARNTYIFEITSANTAARYMEFLSDVLTASTDNKDCWALVF